MRTCSENRQWICQWQDAEIWNWQARGRDKDHSGGLWLKWKRPGSELKEKFDAEEENAKWRHSIGLWLHASRFISSKGKKFRFLIVFKKQESVSIRIVGNCSSASYFMPELFFFCFLFVWLFVFFVLDFFLTLKAEQRVALEAPLGRKHVLAWLPTRFRWSFVQLSGTLRIIINTKSYCLML